MGDPAGIGPEIILKSWVKTANRLPFVVVGDATVLEQRAQALGIELAVQTLAHMSDAALTSPTVLPVLHRPLPSNSLAGRPDPAHGSAIASWIRDAVAAVTSGAARGLVTAPIAKDNLYRSGFSFPGHTEFLADLTAHVPMAGIRGPVMMLTSKDLRTCLVTIHEPLSRVAETLTMARLAQCIGVTDQDLKSRFGIKAPRLAVCGLNPHAGEAGTIGTEERDLIAPAVEQARANGVNVSGPYPADSLFHTEARARYDAVICMYHDQALIPVKMLDFWGGVNVTLGLPIVRTSPDHGTAFDIADRLIARPDSMMAALKLADEMTRSVSP